jgi:hypothetical protein
MLTLISSIKYLCIRDSIRASRKKKFSAGTQRDLRANRASVRCNRERNAMAKTGNLLQLIMSLKINKARFKCRNK